MLMFIKMMIKMMLMRMIYQDENVDVGFRGRGSFVPGAKLPPDEFYLQIDQLGKMKAKVEKDKVLYE